ncbi:hypothetical protein H9X89_16695, partial [Faecalicatena contorta]|nr:hypothetical protein [Faecalicatena contorta]
VALAGDDGESVADAELSVAGESWAKYETTLSVPFPTAADDEPTDGGSRGVIATQGTLRVLFRDAGVVDVDFVSCEPTTTYKG